ncbi:MAG: selenocysteine-specific translation elongation factor [Actinomycetota bacterium]
MTVVGTAGHVDHGKSTLLQAITGRDPDRWEEEKRRGLTIDLGFAWTVLPSGREVSFVDVPGHERFIKNMLAGIEAIDVALFVVAADEGWMPQSEEHLAVLDLLGVERGVVALTKVDRVDDELEELAGLEILEHLEGTSLEGAPVVGVSAQEGRGLEELVAALDAAVADPEPGHDPRLWVDRRFTVAGAGTVVTGTLLGGPLEVGDTLVVHPGGEPVRIRTLQSHERAADRVEPHRRVAASLVGAPEELARGHMLGVAERWSLTSRFTAAVRTARYVEEELGERGAYQIHAGTAAVGARLRSVGEGTLVTLERPLPLRYGDRFIVRETGRRAVVGGGTVLDPRPPARGRPLRASAALPPGLHPREAASALLRVRGSEMASRLEAEAGAAPDAGISIQDWVFTADEMERLEEKATEELEAFHRATPLRPGLPLATLASRLGVTPEVVVSVIERSSALEGDGTLVWAAGHRVTLTEEQEERWQRARSALAGAGLAVPRAAELPIDEEMVHELVRSGDLVRVSGEILYLPEQAEEIRRAVAAMPEGFTVADFRDALGLSRKYAVPILEWADETGLTRRRGDTRTPLSRE